MGRKTPPKTRKKPVRILETYALDHENIFKKSARLGYLPGN